MCCRRSNQPLSDAEIMRIFDDVDTDHSGELSWAEFTTALRARGFGAEFIRVRVELLVVLLYFLSVL